MTHKSYACPDLKELFGKKYRIGLDPSALHEPNGKKDAWYFVVLCKYGEIYPCKEDYLAIHARGRGIIGNLKRLKGLTLHNESDDGEAIFQFPLSMFDAIATIVKPRRKRVLNDNQKQLASERLQKYHFKAKTTQVKHGKQG